MGACHSYQYDGVVGLLQLFHAHIFSYVDVAKEVTARMFGGLGECVDDVLAGMKGQLIAAIKYSSYHVFYNSTRVRKVLDHIM